MKVMIATAMMVLLAALASVPTQAAGMGEKPFTAYLFVHFTGESANGEQIYFSVSTNGLNWHDLNNSAPVLYSNLGEKGVRDPAIIRSADGRKFYILATDLRIANGRGWDAARFEGSHSLIFWESEDLVNWSKPWSVNVAEEIPGAGCTWAPEAIYDESSGDYIVYWATISPKDGVREARIYYAKTRDFRKFTSPELYIERVGEGVNSKDIIDTQIVKVDGGAYKYYRASRDSQITIEAGNSLLGEWTRIGDLSHLGYTAREVEGPILFQFNNERKWCLLVDQYAAGKGYLPLVSSDLSDSQNFRVLEPEEYSLGESHKRHGGILNITTAEYEALLAQWPSGPACRIESLAHAGHYLRHANFVAKLEAHVQPAQDAQWRIVRGLVSEEGAVSLQSVNFPGYFLGKRDSSFILEPNNGTAAFAARASFIRVPGLADSSGVSFRLVGENGQYLLVRDAMLEAGSVISEKDKKQATFLVSGSASPAQAKVPTEKDMAAYLMVYFSDSDHSLHMALSSDGYRFTAVNDNKPVIEGKKVASQKGIRDPHIARGPDGAFYLAMTDLHIFAQREGLRDTEWERDGAKYGWGNNRGFVLMKSKDLIDWKQANVRVDESFEGYDDIGCAWAPETIYDPKEGKLMLYFTMRFGTGLNRVYWSYVNDDFDKLLTRPRVLFEYPGPHTYLDADITQVGEKYHMFYVSHDGTAGIKHAVSDTINWGYAYEPDWIDPEPQACEAPNVWKRIGEDKWVLMYDCYGIQPHNFGFSETTDFKTYTHLGYFNEGVMKSTNFTSPKHGAVIHLTKQEADRLAQHWKLASY